MGKIIDYYKNSKFYQDNLLDLIPTNELYLNIHDLLKEEINLFDDLTINKRKFISDNISDILVVNDDIDYLSYNILDESIELTFSKREFFFDITAYIEESNFDDHQPVFITHRFYENKQELIIEEDLTKGGYCGTINLNNLYNSIEKEIDIEELETIKKILNKFTNFMITFYDQSKPMKLEKKKRG